MSRKRDSQQLRGVFDSNDPFMVFGHRIRKVRSGTHHIPEWTKDPSKVQALLLRSFPKLKDDPLQRARAGRWATVIHLYFTMALTTGDIAEELKIRERSVLSIVRSIRRVSNGQRADGSGPLGAKRGRPKKHAIIQVSLGEGSEALKGTPPASVEGAGPLPLRGSEKGT